METLKALFSSNDFMPHIHCYLAKPSLVWTMATTDLVIGLSYLSISLSLYALIRRIKLPFSAMFLAFGVFILACGLTHFMEVYTLWIPRYWLSAAVKVITAIASSLTAVLLIRIQSKVVAFSQAARNAEEKLRCARDELEQRVVERTVELEFSKKRLQFLSEATKAISSTFDYEESSKTVAHLAIPYLADWCVVDFLQADGEVKRIAVAHSDPEKSNLTKKLEKYPPHSSQPAGSWTVIHTGMPELVLNVNESLLQGRAHNEEHADILKKLGVKTFIIHPLLARGKTLGSMTFVMSDSNRVYSNEDIELAKELTLRVGVAIDNSILYREAQQALQSRDEFLSVASHELKTPLTALHMRLQILQRRLSKTVMENRPFSLAEELEVIEICKGQSGKLSGLMEELLDLARIRTGRLNLSVEKVNLTPLIYDLVTRFKDQAKECGNKITVHTNPNEAIIGYWDRTRLEQAATNLISNAIKYGKGNPIDVWITSDPSSGIARLTVEDHGMGLAPGLQTQIFERFERGSHGNKISGLGLGLYITRQIVDAHGGKIGVSSQVDVGSKFDIEIPLRGVQKVQSANE